MKKILITGGTGFIGEHLMKKISKSNNNLLVVSRKSLKSENKNVRYLKADLSSKKDLIKIKKDLGKCDILISMSAITPKGGEQGLFENDIKDNFLSNVLLLPFLKNVKKIIFLSSIDVYGDQGDKLITEDNIPNPITNYGAAKLASEIVLKTYCEEKSIKLTILRLGQVYGAGDKSSKIIPVVVDKIFKEEPIVLFNNGRDKRRFLHIKDAVCAINKALRSSKGGVFNIAGEEISSVKEIINLVERILDRKAVMINKNNNKGLWHYAMDIKKAKKELGFSPKISLEMGIGYLIKNEL